MGHWLFKSEEDVFSINDLKACKNRTDSWEGVRNYQARNFLRDDIKKGDMVLFYHSNTKVPGVAGIARVVKEGYPDHFAFDARSKYHDPKSSPDNPRWYMVDVKHVKTFKETVPLTALKENPKLKDMKILQRGNRLSVTPVTEKEYNEILKMAGEK